ncbi:hypothetical protein [Nocardia sp. NPDC052566]|uniref:hypothetical protein n=1 Tax=Nocardia sp. NPDC052566 TaxID=3364330 RepID=UPI0037CA798C
MATIPATIVIHETGRVERLQMADNEPLAWLRAVLVSDTVDHIPLGPQMRLYYDPESTRAENSVTSEMLRAYPAESPGTIRGAVAVCRWDQRAGAVHDLFVAQVDRISERFLRDIVARERVCSLVIDPISGSLKKVNIPSGSVETWFAELLDESDRPRRKSGGIAVVELQREIVMISAALIIGRTNLPACDLHAAFVDRSNPMVLGPALICREDPNTGMYTDLEKEQFDRVMIVYNSMPNYYRSMGYRGSGKPERRWTNSQKGELGFRFGKDD